MLFTVLRRKKEKENKTKEPALLAYLYCKGLLEIINNTRESDSYSSYT